MEFLMGNPFSTPVGQRVESATGSSLPSEDWALNMEICDMINSSEEGPKDAVRALKKRIVGNRNFKEVMLALTVLETCVKNCGYKFHILVTTRDFVEGVLVRSIIPKNNPPLILHDRVLGIVQAWADAFRSSPDLTGVVSVYEDLRRKGLEFPVTELDGYAPVQAPQKVQATSDGAHSSLASTCCHLVTFFFLWGVVSLQSAYQPSPGNGPSVTTLPSALLSSKPPLIPPLTSELKLALEENNALTSVQVKQLKTELGVVRSNLTMMSDMMTQLDPVTVKEADVELLEQLYTVCKEMQDRIVKVVPRLSEEKLIEELLAANDEINSAFTRYHRFERRIPNSQSAAEKSQTYVNLTDFDLTPESVSQSGLASVTNSSFSLSKADSFSSQMARLSTSESDDALSQNVNVSTRQRPSELSEVAEDGLAEARDSRLRSAATDDSPASTRSASPKLDWMIKRGMIPLNQSTVMDDIEKWLALDNEYEDFEDADGVTSEEFDKFLAGRAQAAERLPSLRASSQDANHSQSSATPGT